MKPALILHALWSLGGQAGTVDIFRLLCLRYDHNFLIADVHIAADKLVAAGLIESRHEEGGPERGGRLRRVLKVTAFVSDQAALA